MWKLNLANLMAYRGNFINNVIASVAWGSFSLYSMYILTNRITSAYGWSRNEILLFNGIYGIIVGIFHMTITINMRRFSRVIHQGDLDLILTKPIDSQFSLSLWLTDFTIILRILIALGYTIWFIQLLGIFLSIFQVLGIVVIAVFSLILLYSIWYSVLSLLIYDSSLSNLVLVLYQVESFARFPREVAQQLTNVVFLILLPITLVINTPTRLVLGKISWLDITGLMVVSLTFFFISRRIWLRALRNYVSASS